MAHCSQHIPAPTVPHFLPYTSYCRENSSPENPMGKCFSLAPLGTQPRSCSGSDMNAQGHSPPKHPPRSCVHLSEDGATDHHLCTCRRAGRHCVQNPEADRRVPAKPGQAAKQQENTGLTFGPYEAEAVFDQPCIQQRLRVCRGLVPAPLVGAPNHGHYRTLCRLWFSYRTHPG